MSRIKNFRKRLRVTKNLTKQSEKVNFKTESIPSTALNGSELVEGQGLNRREFLKLSAITATGGLATIVLASSGPLSMMSKTTSQLSKHPEQVSAETSLLVTVDASSVSVMDPSTIPKFENQLTAPPPVYQPNVITSQGKIIRHDYTVTMASFEQQILPPSMNLLTSVWGYGGVANDAVTGVPLGFVQSSPGPTFEAVRGVPVKVKWQNNIASPYMIAVDPTIHWANPNNSPMQTSTIPKYPPGFPDAQSPVPLVTHLHGGQNQSFSDGGPEQWFTQNGKHGKAYYTYETTDSNASVYYYPNTQEPTTLWYHDHGLGVTRLSVMSGLAGFYLIREPTGGNDKVGPLLPIGKYEMPLVIQDRSFNTDGSLYYPSIGSVTDAHPYWVNMFMGNTIMVNGKVWPNMNVDMGQYRFRLLNGSNSRIYNIAFSNGMSFIQIGSDGGYLKAPVQLASLTLAPAERADIIVDFSNLTAGMKIILQNTTGETASVGQIMQFTVNNAQGSTPFNIDSAPKPFSPTLAGNVFPTLPNPTKRRVLTLYEIAGANGLTSEALLDGQTWDASISETPEVGTTEEWVIVNPTMDAHPIHIHLVQFQLVNRQLFNASSSYLDEWIGINGNPPFNHPTKNVSDLQSFMYTNQIAPQPQEEGWKDTIIVNQGEVVTIRVRFAPQDGTSFPFDATAGPGYVWHCHILEHEDNEMMRPYKVASPAQNWLPVIIPSVTVAAVTVLLYLYYHQVRRKKRDREDEKSVNHLTLLGEDNEMPSSVELNNANNYEDLQDCL